MNPQSEIVSLLIIRAYCRALQYSSYSRKIKVRMKGNTSISCEDRYSQGKKTLELHHEQNKNAHVWIMEDSDHMICFIFHLVARISFWGSLICKTTEAHPEISIRGHPSS